VTGHVRPAEDLPGVLIVETRPVTERVRVRNPRDAGELGLHGPAGGRDWQVRRLPQGVAVLDHLMLGDAQVGEGLAEAGLQVGQRDVQAEGPPVSARQFSVRFSSKHLAHPAELAPVGELALPAVGL
jgi:hypothetical protein